MLPGMRSLSFERFPQPWQTVSRIIPPFGTYWQLLETRVEHTEPSTRAQSHGYLLLAARKPAPTVAGQRRVTSTHRASPPVAAEVGVGSKPLHLVRRHLLRLHHCFAEEGDGFPHLRASPHRGIHQSRAREVADTDRLEEDTAVLHPSVSSHRIRNKYLPKQPYAVRTCIRRKIRTPWRLSSHSLKRGLTAAIAACPNQ